MKCDHIFKHLNAVLVQSYAGKWIHSLFYINIFFFFGMSQNDIKLFSSYFIGFHLVFFDFVATRIHFSFRHREWNHSKNIGFVEKGEMVVHLIFDFHSKRDEKFSFNGIC